MEWHIRELEGKYKLYSSDTCTCKASYPPLSFITSLAPPRPPVLGAAFPVAWMLVVQFRFILQDQLQILTPGNRNTITASQTAEQMNTQHPSVKGEDKDYGWTLISSPHSVLLHSILTPSVSPPHQGGGDVTEGSDQYSLSPS